MEVTNILSQPSWGYGGHLLVRAVKERHGQDFTSTKQMFLTDEKFYLMGKKGVFSYAFFSDLSKLNDNEFPRENLFIKS